MKCDCLIRAMMTRPATGSAYNFVAGRFADFERNYLQIQTIVLTLAEREGFEPPDPCESTVFKTAALNHSAISPKVTGCLERSINHS